MYGYQGDGLTTEHYSGWRLDPGIQAALKAGYDTIRSRRPDLNVDYRIMVCLWAARQAFRLSGDFLECGVHTGIYSRAIMEYLNDFWAASGKTLWLLDTFNGIPQDQVSQHNAGMNRKYADNVYPEVAKTFSQFQNVNIIQGAVPETLRQVEGDGLGNPSLAYVSIDMNNPIAEKAAAYWAWPRMVPGAIMLLDDYGFRAHAEQRRALDDWAGAVGANILPMPTGQGLMVK